MTNTSSFAKPQAQRVLLTAGLVTGTLDIITACTYYSIRTGNNPVKVLKFVASGLFGKEALSGGAIYAFWGLLFHYLIAFTFAFFFFWIYPKWKGLAFNKWITALGYGLFVWLVMNLAVVPLSQTPKGPFQLTQAIIGAAILICMIGLPNTLITGKYYAGRSDSEK
ncbi:MAG: hypothetical protein V4450_07960 [Bacteroidota bacterium]